MSARKQCAPRLPVLKVLKPFERWKIVPENDPDWQRWEMIERELTEIKIKYARLLFEKKNLRLKLLEQDILHHKALCPRERQVLDLIQRDPTILNKEIADKMGITSRTVKFHVGRLMQKCGVQSRHDLPNIALMGEEKKGALHA